jgi:hypothetical protein
MKINLDYIGANANKLIIGAFVFAVIFIMIGHIYKEQIQSLLKHPLYTVKSFDLDYWSVTHFLLFAFIGFVKPEHVMTFFSIGVAFEIFEDGMASDATTQLINCKDKNVKRSMTGDIFCKGYEDSYWYGKADDIIINLLGYLTGQGMRRLM